MVVAVLGITLAVVGEVLVLTSNLFPPAAAQEAHVVDDAFRTLLVLAVPVFALVVAALAYSILRFRRRGDPTQDGPPIRSHGPFIAIWLLVTSALTAVMIVYPGVTGLLELRAHADAFDEAEGLVVRAEGSRWFWQVAYPQHGVTTRDELVLPVGRQVRFEVSATDVIHAFWIPAFRIKIDAVPGLVTTTHATPDRVGSLADESGLRLQCAELCGLNHALMQLPVRVVAPEEFEAWVARQRAVATR
jgi:cytochrome c oxidase subunit 2